MKKFIILLSLFAFMPAISMAATFVSEYDIVSDTTWTKENSPYVLNNNLHIANGATLTLLPGTIIKAGPNIQITIDGKIIANGSKDERIYFTSISDDSVGGDTNDDGAATLPNSGGFSSISFTGLAESPSLSFITFKYARNGINFDGVNSLFDNISISYGTYGIVVKDKSLIVFSNLDIKNIILGAISIYGSSSVSIVNSMIDGVSWGDAIGIYDSSLLLDKTTVKSVSNYGTPISLSGANVKILNSEISNKQGYSSGNGINVNKNSAGVKSVLDIQNSKISGLSACGINSSQSVVSISQSIIEKNGIGLCAYYSSFNILESKISKNPYGGIYEYKSDIADAKNNFWGDASGPQNSKTNPNGLGNKVSDGVTFVPWLTEDPTLKPKCCSSIAFIPGLEASRLYKNGVIFENQLWEPNRNADVESLFLDSDGKSLDNSIYTRDVIDEINFIGLDVYKGFMENMENLKTKGEIMAWKVFPYDWRFDLNEIIDNGSKIDSSGTIEKMIPEIEKMAKNSKTGKVTLIGHSNGGLVSKLLIKKLEEQGKAGLIDKLILVAVPELGTPKAVAGLLHGYRQDILGGLILDKAVARKMGENMPGGYQLLPSAKYFERISDPVIKFDSSLDGLNNFYTAYGSEISSVNELSDFLLGKNDGRIVSDNQVDQPLVLNSKLLEKSANIHEIIDNYTIPENIKAMQIVGWGLDTVKAIEYYRKEKVICVDRGVCNTQKFLDYRPIFTQDGDETVVTASADAMPVETYYLDLPAYNFGPTKNRKHLNITESQSVIDLINNTIIGTTTLPKFISTEKPIPTNEDNRLRLSGHSPISIDLYDEYGNHTGIVQKPDSDTQYIEEKIPNSYYLPFGEGKYVGFDANSSTTVKILGTGIGTFTLNVDKVSGGQTATGISYEDIPVLPITIATFKNDGDINTLQVDLDGDGTNDFILKPSEAFDPIQYLQVMRKVVGGFDLNNGVKQSLLNKIDTTIKMIQKGKSQGVEKRITAFLHGIEKDNKKHQKINSNEQQIIIQMLNNLLDNLK